MVIVMQILILKYPFQPYIISKNCHKFHCIQIIHYGESFTMENHQYRYETMEISIEIWAKYYTKI